MVPFPFWGAENGPCGPLEMWEGNLSSHGELFQKSKGVNRDRIILRASQGVQGIFRRSVPFRVKSRILNAPLAPPPPWNG